MDKLWTRAKSAGDHICAEYETCNPLNEKAETGLDAAGRKESRQSLCMFCNPRFAKGNLDLVSAAQLERPKSMGVSRFWGGCCV